MRWGFRVATAPDMGAGHILRCLALADSLGDPVTVFTDDEHGWSDCIAAAGCREVREHSADSLNTFADAARSGTLDAVLVDGYRFRDDDVTAVAACVFASALPMFYPRC